MWGVGVGVPASSWAVKESLGMEAADFYTKNALAVTSEV